jgi:hypothetical protein
LTLKSIFLAIKPSINSIKPSIKSNWVYKHPILDFFPQIEFSFPTGLSSFKYILSKFQSLTSLINCSDHFMCAPASYCYYNFFQFLPTIYLYIFFLFYARTQKMGYNKLIQFFLSVWFFWLLFFNFLCLISFFSHP